MNPTQVAPRVTVLIVSTDRLEQLRRCLDALDRSTLRADTEILVIDSGSRDGTSSAVSDYESATVMRLPKHFGRTKALNIGMRTARGSHVLFLDPWHVVRPDTLDRLVNRLEADESVGAVCPSVDQAYPLPGPKELKQSWTTRTLPGSRVLPPSPEEHAVDCVLGTPLLVRRAFLKGMNYFDDRFGEYWCDLELCWQLRNARKQILVLGNVEIDENQPPEPSSRMIDAADSANGAAAYLSKHFGTAVAARFRAAVAMQTLGRMVSFRDPGNNANLLIALLSGRKIDGTQS